MERLTNCKEITKESDMTKQLGYTHIYKRLAEYEDTGLMPNEIKENTLSGIELANIACSMMKLRTYEDAEDQGLLMRLPCKAGDVIYFKDECQLKVTRIVCNNTLIWHAYAGRKSFALSDVGKTVFLTKAEAEKALEEM